MYNTVSVLRPPNWHQVATVTINNFTNTDQNQLTTNTPLLGVLNHFLDRLPNPRLLTALRGRSRHRLHACLQQTGLQESSSMPHTQPRGNAKCVLLFMSLQRSATSGGNSSMGLSSG
ncbi:unnamed protein product [Polarella glacialis]|uniref:Uncharacterized protein n=1 Tax=Polarella glacialis TaxID=89957 RepID=A0A813LP34_POLGL|nr:unnamed protein product [Polarella glacialis]